MRVLSQIYAQFPATPTDRYKTFSSNFGSVIAFFGLLLGLFTFVFNGWRARRSQRKQHTITVLLETRLSEYFQSTITKRRAVFPEYTDVSFDEWNAARTAQPENSTPTAEDQAQKRRDGAAALAQMLNYYEFLAVGISEGDLDEKMLKKTIRGIMCNLVDDARDVIAGMQQDSPKTYEHLTTLYDDWRKPGATDINGNPNERPIPKR